MASVAGLTARAGAQQNECLGIEALRKRVGKVTCRLLKGWRETGGRDPARISLEVHLVTWHHL